MNALDVMTRDVITVEPETSVVHIAKLMLQHRISAVPVVNAAQELVGIVSEGDLLRRAEIGTEKLRSPWIRLWLDRRSLAEDYIREHARTAEQVMTPDVITVSEDTPLSKVVEIMEKHRIKRVPVMRGADLVGIIGRSNLVRALVMAGDLPGPKPGDDAIRLQIVSELARQPWAPASPIEVGVFDGVVTLWGSVASSEQHEALRLLVSGTKGVRDVKSLVTVATPERPLAYI